MSRINSRDEPERGQRDFGFRHRASAARRAISLRSSAETPSHRALPPFRPPFRPSLTAAGSFRFLAIVYHPSKRERSRKVLDKRERSCIIGGPDEVARRAL